MRGNGEEGTGTNRGAAHLSLGSHERAVTAGRRTTLTLATDAGTARLGAWTVDVGYDPKAVKLVSCEAASGGACNPAFAAGTMRITGASAAGLTGTRTLAQITVEGIGHGKATSPLKVTAVTLTDPSGADVSTAATDTPPTTTPTATPTAAPPSPSPASRPGRGGR